MTCNQIESVHSSIRLHRYDPYLFIFAVRNKFLQMSNMFDVEVEVIVRRVSEYGGLIDLIELPDVVVNLLLEDILIVLD